MKDREMFMNIFIKLYTMKNANNYSHKATLKHSFSL